MWSNIGNVAEHKKSVEFVPGRRRLDSEKAKENGLYFYADCHSATKGILYGKYNFKAMLCMIIFLPI